MTEKTELTKSRRRPTGAEIQLQELAVGTRLRLRDGAEVEIVENPRDGQWVFVRNVALPSDQKAELVFTADVVELVEE